MHVLVTHAISDPQGFRAAEDKLGEEIEANGWPTGIRGNPITLISPDQTSEFCLFEADSIETVRDLLEPTMGEPGSRNTYYEIDPATVPTLASA